MPEHRGQIVATRMVQDPSMSDAEYFHQRQKKSGPHVGKVAARVNMLALIGGFARFRDRTEAQEAAAARFRGIWERAQIGGAKAMDYAAVKVDTSGPSEDAMFEIGEDARYQYRTAVKSLGMLRSSLVERIVVHDVSISLIAGRGARARARVTKDFLDALDDLAEHFAHGKRKGAGKRKAA
jgi:hypothetical protein